VPASTNQDHLIARISQTQRQLRQHLAEHQTHPLLDAHITMSQLKVLIILARTGGTTAHELAEHAGASPGNADRHRRSPGDPESDQPQEVPHDRRVRRLELTTAGAELVERLIANNEQWQHRLLQNVDEDGLQAIALAFDLLLEAATRLDDETGALDDETRAGEPEDQPAAARA